ncbi:hypothetical protein SSX86_008445 [Deinandra increscens subsp. villosa]|uniref:Uncharacterized protein n=1 Tax=Deinandra increscens subsp. villosa TaxID=3103831 RepID=A0AAP0H220_9ASTR
MAASAHSIAAELPTIYPRGKTHPVSKDSSSLLNQLPCYSTTSASITLLRLAMRSFLDFLFNTMKHQTVSDTGQNGLGVNVALAHGKMDWLGNGSKWILVKKQLGASSISMDEPVPSVVDLSDQILVVLNHFRLGSVMCMGAMAGAYILTLFAIKYSERVTGLILISPICRAASWNEWFYNKIMSRLLYYCGMCDIIKELLIQRYFSKGVCGNLEVPESEMVRACRKLLGERDSINVWRYLRALDRRPDITKDLESLECKTIIFVGDHSPFHDEALHMSTKLGRDCSTLVEVHPCGSMVTVEQPHAMLIPLEYFLKGFGLYRSCQFNDSPRSPLDSCCIDPKLLYPEHMGLKLRPIKTRVSPLQPRANKS